ncbi:hypothetical protein JRQ81_006068 [Phrynocephalus forsythii]|uniref:Uncharacterized protein n=1 Tax=Phrynocephalus forsythii TaxID=171643 RepID=A0A9Q1AVJ3_9SAUR|nr:hypothetical protein JRQ81_006068 [Phrynocephalus forsythii]
MDAASLLQEQVSHSSQRQSSIDVEANTLAQVSPEDSTNRLAKLPKEGRKEKWRLKGSSGSRRIRGKTAAQSDRLRRHPYAPEVDPYYYHINWPQAVLQKWTTDKLKKSFTLTISQEATTKDQGLGCTEPQAEKGDT